MRFQERDGAIISAIYNLDGVLARRHLKHMFWPNATLRAVQKRLAKLINDGYLARPTPHQRKTQPIPEPVYFLGWRGILWIASQNNAMVSPPSNQGENQMRKLAKMLRDQGVRWVREPRWIQLAHDLAVVDFRLAVEYAIQQVPTLCLEEWIHEGAFRSDWDTVECQITGTDGKVKRVSKRMFLDGFFSILDEQRLARARFLLELDNATHPNNRFGREKVVPGLAYIKSLAFKARFGDNTGRWLIVTTGTIRMRNLIRQTQKVVGAGGANIFLFTTFDQLGTGNILTEPIWWQTGKEEPVPLFAGAQTRHV